MDAGLQRVARRDEMSSESHTHAVTTTSSSRFLLIGLAEIESR
jgi:hypothetical protein